MRHVPFTLTLSSKIGPMVQSLIFRAVGLPAVRGRVVGDQEQTFTLFFAGAGHCISVGICKFGFIPGSFSFAGGIGFGGGPKGRRLEFPAAASFTREPKTTAAPSSTIAMQLIFMLLMLLSPEFDGYRSFTKRQPSLAGHAFQSCSHRERSFGHTTGRAFSAE